MNVYTLHRDQDRGRDSGRCHWFLYPILSLGSSSVNRSSLVSLLMQLGAEGHLERQAGEEQTGGEGDDHLVSLCQ